MNLGANQTNLGSFKKYVDIAQNIQNLSLEARVVPSAERDIERVEKLIELTTKSLIMRNSGFVKIVCIVHAKLVGVQKNGTLSQIADARY
jgi:hypothetical protein